MGITVRRPGLEAYLRRGGRRLLYGRRKTGKTFYARLVLEGYRYYIVRRSGAFYDPLEDYEADVRGVLRECRGDSRVIVDEFHRADPRFFDALQAGECPEAVLITSTLHYHRRLVEGRDAPLAGLFQGYRVGLVSPVDLLSTPALAEVIEEDPKGGMERIVFYQEPVWIGSRLEDVVRGGYDFTISLVGEVLDEEEAAYSRRLLGVLAAVAAGRERLTEVTGHLYSRGLLPRPETGLVVKYLSDAVRFGLLERVPVHGAKRRSVYRHPSPVTHLAFYLQEKYSYYDIPQPESTGVRLAENVTPFLVERLVERLLAELYGLRPVRVLEPETDVALARGSTIVVAAEVKWRKRITQAEARRAEERLSRLGARAALLVVPDASEAPETGLTVVDARGLVEAARSRRPPVPV